MHQIKESKARPPNPIGARFSAEPRRGGPLPSNDMKPQHRVRNLRRGLRIWT